MTPSRACILAAGVAIGCQTQNGAGVAAPVREPSPIDSAAPHQRRHAETATAPAPEPFGASRTSIAAAPALPRGGASCTFHGKPLWGKVQVVDAFADVKVQRVDAFPTLKVQKVDAFPDSCGKWQFVDAFPDITIQFVDAFPDVTIQFVDAFPGAN